MRCTPCQLALPLALGLMVLSQGQVALGLAIMVLGTALNWWVGARTGRAMCAPAARPQPPDPRFRQSVETGIRLPAGR